MRPVTKGILGRRFGMLTAMQRVEPTETNRGFWLCRCDCGRATYVRDSTHLIDGRRTSCGCSRPRKRNDYVAPTAGINVTGLRFGNLTAVRRAETVDQRGQGAHWLFKCDCGTSALLRLKDVRNGNTASCGCMKSGPGGRHRTAELDINRPWRKADHVDDRWLVLVGERAPRSAA